MKEQLLSLWTKVVEHKSEVIKTTGAVAGAVLGVVVAAMISNAMDEQPSYEDMVNDLTDESE
jgi:hypothetical protein